MKTALVSQQNKRSAAKLMSLFVAIVGMSVVLGWIFDVPALKSIHPYWVSMKFSTALCFLLSGVSLYFIIRVREGEFDMAQVVLSMTSLVIILLMGTLFFSFLFGINTGLEDLFVKDSNAGAKTVFPGRPSFLTIMNFILIAAAGIITLLNIEKIRSKLKIIGFTIGTIGTLAVVGYMIDVPLLYYYVSGINSAMAFHTAALFVLLGIGFVCL